MKILFIHQNAPAQFRHLAPTLAGAGHTVVFLTRRQGFVVPGCTMAYYGLSREAAAGTHQYLRRFEDAVLHGQAVVRACLSLIEKGFRPDLVIAHPGWGESMFIKDVFPSVPLINYCEYYYTSVGADLDFNRSSPAPLDVVCRMRARNSHLLLGLESCDVGLAPTEWQRSRHPAAFRDKIVTIFDGIDTVGVHPSSGAALVLPNGRRLDASDEVVTYVARNLEPYRGFPSFVGALPKILRERPNAVVLIVGGDEPGYGGPAPDGRTWREIATADVELPPDRVHFLGKVPFETYVTILQISSVHVYLTYPFVLSWSLMEAMAAECVIVASKTAPVEEVMVDGENGYFTDFFDVAAIADTVTKALTASERTRIRRAARQTILDRYDLRSCLPKQLQLVHETARRFGAGGA